MRIHFLEELGAKQSYTCNTTTQLKSINLTNIPGAVFLPCNLVSVPLPKLLSENSFSEQPKFGKHPALWAYACNYAVNAKAFQSQ